MDKAQRSERAVILERVIPATMNSLSAKLSSTDLNILHLLCHGNLAEDGMGEAILSLQDRLGDEEIVTATQLIDIVRGKVAFVVLNSCWTARQGYRDVSNLAYALVRDAVPYALGMQVPIDERAAFVFSNMLYEQLWQGVSIEEAVRLARQAILNDRELAKRAAMKTDWLAGIPVFYTSMKDSLPPIPIPAGTAQIKPNPDMIRQRQQLEIRPTTQFVGRGEELVKIADKLLQAQERRPAFVTIHGIGGAGKTALAYECSERLAWHFDWRVFWVSLEQLPSSEESFLRQLANYYLSREELEHLLDVGELRRLLIQKIRHTKSILVVDNLETLLWAIRDKNSNRHDVAEAIGAVLRNIANGSTAIILTSRESTGWAGEHVVEVPKLSPEDGAQLFRDRLRENRRVEASPVQARQLSIRVGGHPLSIRLLAGQFSERYSGSLETFMHDIEKVLVDAEDNAPDSLHDRDRQRTLYACMAYSIEKLTAQHLQALRTLQLFQAPFIYEAGASVLNQENAEQIIQDLERFGLLEDEERLFVDGKLTYYTLHPMLRWYVDWGLTPPKQETKEHYYTVMRALISQVADSFWSDARLRDIASTCLQDFVQVGQQMTQEQRSNWAYNLAEVLSKMGLPQQALERYQQSLASNVELDDKRGIAITQSAMANVLKNMGQPHQALELYQQSLVTMQELGDKREIAITQNAMALILSRMGQPQEALELYQQSLATMQDLGNIRSIAITQHVMADVLVEMGQLQQALELYQQSLATKQELGDKREIGIIQHAMADVLVQMGQLQQALELFQQSLAIDVELGDKRGSAGRVLVLGGVVPSQLAHLPLQHE
ncbi:MAG: tetratricopeptide repeat protein [Chloroflexota bacterium]